MVSKPYSRSKWLSLESCDLAHFPFLRQAVEKTVNYMVNTFPIFVLGIQFCWSVLLEDVFANMCNCWSMAFFAIFFPEYKIPPKPDVVQKLNKIARNMGFLLDA